MSFTQNSKTVESSLLEIDYAIEFLIEALALIDSGEAQKEDYEQLKEKTVSCEEWLDEVKGLFRQMEDQMETDKQERVVEIFQERYKEFKNKFKRLKPSADRILNNKKIIRALEDGDDLSMPLTIPGQQQAQERDDVPEMMVYSQTEDIQRRKAKVKALNKQSKQLNHLAHVMNDKIVEGG